MKKFLLSTIIISFFTLQGFSQNNEYVIQDNLSLEIIIDSTSVIYDLIPIQDIDYSTEMRTSLQNLITKCQETNQVPVDVTGEIEEFEESFFNFRHAVYEGSENNNIDAGLRSVINRIDKFHTWLYLYNNWVMWFDK